MLYTVLELLTSFAFAILLMKLYVIASRE